MRIWRLRLHLTSSYPVHYCLLLITLPPAPTLKRILQIWIHCWPDFDKISEDDAMRFYNNCATFRQNHNSTSIALLFWLTETWGHRHRHHSYYSRWLGYYIHPLLLQPEPICKTAKSSFELIPNKTIKSLPSFRVPTMQPTFDLSLMFLELLHCVWI